MVSRKDSKGRKLREGESERKDGRYSYRVTDPITGKRKCYYAKDLPGLREIEKQVRRDVEDGIKITTVGDSPTLNEVFEKYKLTRNWSQTSQINNERVWKNLIAGSIGTVKVTQLKRSNLKAFFNSLAKQGYKKGYIDAAKILVSATLEIVESDGIIRSNPAVKLGKFGKPAGEKIALTQEQQKTLLDYIKNSKTYSYYYPVYAFMLETGLRCGELAGLTWNDVNLKDRTVKVCRQIRSYPVNGETVLDIAPPKTSAGNRTIPLTNAAYTVLLEQKKNLMKRPHKKVAELNGYSGFVFTTKNDGLFCPSVFTSTLYRIVRSINENSGSDTDHEPFPMISAHVLRHTACTNMLRDGVNIKVIQYVMGHSNISMTMDIYSHVTGLNEVKKAFERRETNIS